MSDLPKYYLWDLWVKNSKHKLVYNIPTKKMVYGTNTCEEKYESWTYVQKIHKKVGICAPNTTKMNWDNQHANTDLELEETQTSEGIVKGWGTSLSGHISWAKEYYK